VPAASVVHEFGSFRLDPAERLLLRAGEHVSLTPKAFDLLVYLVDHAGRLVTKQELMSALWPNTFVEEANLAFTVSALRKALGDGQDGEQFIQTVPTRGYRFVAPVTHDENRPVSSTSETPVRSLQPLVRRIATTALAVAVIAMLPVVVRHMRETTDAPAAVKFTIPQPDSAVTTDSTIQMSKISPDGRRVAFIMESRIWLRTLDSQAAPLRIAGTEDARALFWAPDSQQFAFSTPSALKKLRLSDGTVQTLCDSCQPTGGGTWSRGGTIVFATLDGSLLGIAAAGGKPQAVTSLDRSRGEIGHLYPHFLPDGVRFLYLRRNADVTKSGLHIGQIGSVEPQLLLEGDLPAIYATPGYLLFLRAGTLTAQRFDPGRLKFSGEASPLVPTWGGNPLVSQVAFSASETGVLTYAILERPVTQFQWVGRDGKPQQVVGEPGRYYTFDLSGDASRLAFGRVEAGDASLEVHDLGLDVTKRLTFGASFYADPRWIADSQRLVATRWRPLPQVIVQISPDRPESIVSVSGEGNMVEDVSRDGQYLLYRQRPEHLRAMSLSEGSKPVPVRKAPAGSMNQSQFSPNNRWIAYHSNETGRFEVYVTPFPPTGESWPVSSGGGVQPVWRQDGRELYYLGLDGTLNSVEVRTGERPQFSSRLQLFQTGLRPSDNIEQYAASGDGQRFLLLKVVEDKNLSSTGVILNWPSLLPATRSR
jgi:DNA-binding winged helix-turn-helix (wHTH) protein/Tol biopolymer transport system component